MPSYEEVLEMDAAVVFERVVESEPQQLYLLLNDMRDIIREGTFPLNSFYNVKSTDEAIRRLLDPSELFTTKNETN